MSTEHQCGFRAGGLRNAPRLCTEPAMRYWNKSWLCDKHTRFIRMRRSAQDNGKTVPSYEELERLFAALVNMACSYCGHEMCLMRSQSRQRVITLQHDDDGTFRFLCQACNTRHAHVRDEMYQIPLDSHRCSFWQGNQAEKCIL